MADEQQTFRVIWTEKLRQLIRELGTRAIQAGSHVAFFHAMHSMVNALTSEPLTWGDPLYHLRSADLLICHRMHQAFHVYYGVDEKRRIVYVKELLLMPGKGLES